MFPFQLSDELLLKISSNPNQQHRIFQNQILSNSQHHDTSCMYNNLSTTGGCEENPTPAHPPPPPPLPPPPRLKPCVMSSYDGESSDKMMKKKMVHREVERQRRQEMAALYASLRSLLPLEFIKGKRSVSDQMNEAVKYIKHLEKNIKELSVKREELTKALSDNSVFSSRHSSTIDEHYCSSHCAIVRPCLVGVEIVLSGSLRLSKVLQVLVEEGLCVISCVSTTVDDSLIHTIHAEANDPLAGIDLPELQQKLTRMMN